MPVYDFECRECSVFYPDIVMTLDQHDQGFLCEVCGELAPTYIGPVDTIGPMPSKPYKLGGADVMIHSKEELKAYEAANPNAKVMSNTDSWMRGHRDRARERAEGVARRQGFRDWEHRQDSLRTENKKRKESGG